MSMDAEVEGRVIVLSDSSLTKEQRRKNASRAAELYVSHDKDQTVNPTATVDLPGTEIKSAVYKDGNGRPGRFTFRDRQHDHIARTNASYELVVLTDIGSSAYVICGIMPIEPHEVSMLIGGHSEWDNGSPYSNGRATIPHSDIFEMEMATYSPSSVLADADLNSLDLQLNELDDWAIRAYLSGGNSSASAAAAN